MKEIAIPTLETGTGEREHAAIRLAGALGQVVLVFVLACVLTLVLMIPVLIFTVYRLSRDGTLDQAGQAFADWDAVTLLTEIWHHPAFYYGSTIAQAIGFIAAAAIVYKLSAKQGWSMGWATPNRRLSAFGRGCLLGAALIAGVFAAMSLTGVVSSLQGQASASAWAAVGSYALFLALVTVNEEVFVQGFTQGLLRHRLGHFAGAVGSTLLFTLMHALNPGVLDQAGLPLLNTALFGMLLALCRESSGGLWLPIGVHWVWYWAQGCMLGFPVSGTNVPSLLVPQLAGPILLTGGTFGAEGSLLTTAALSLITVAMLIRARQGKPFWFSMSRK